MYYAALRLCEANSCKKITCKTASVDVWLTLGVLTKLKAPTRMLGVQADVVVWRAYYVIQLRFPRNGLLDHNLRTTRRRRRWTHLNEVLPHHGRRPSYDGGRHGGSRHPLNLTAFAPFRVCLARSKEACRRQNGDDIDFFGR